MQHASYPISNPLWHSNPFVTQKSSFRDASYPLLRFRCEFRISHLLQALQQIYVSKLPLTQLQKRMRTENIINENEARHYKTLCDFRASTWKVFSPVKPSSGPTAV